MKTIVFFLILLFFDFSQADNTRTFLLVGIGTAQGTSANGNQASKSESPGAFDIQIDFPLYNSLFIFAEHFRSLGTTGSSIGFTGAGIKHYPWLNPSNTNKILIFDKSQISASGFLPFIGAGLGVSQASIISPEAVSSASSDVLAAGGYFSIKAGTEYSWSKSWGFSSEFNFGMTIIGSGTIQAFNLLFGSYLVF